MYSDIQQKWASKSPQNSTPLYVTRPAGTFLSKGLTVPPLCIPLSTCSEPRNYFTTTDRSVVVHSALIYCGSAWGVKFVFYEFLCCGSWNAIFFIRLNAVEPVHCIPQIIHNPMPDISTAAPHTTTVNATDVQFLYLQLWQSTQYAHWGHTV